jgi:2,4-dienoyl-CoA reductase-like NADH-dependent reductase (Old Yellow Enzyme family)
MMQCKAVDGFATDWHLVHFGKFALGGFGTVMTEVVAIEPRGRITYGDIGLWSDEQMVPLKRISDFLHQHGSLAAMQIGHAGRKAAWQRPWEGNGPLQPADAARGDPPWQLDGPSDEAVGEGYATPHVLTVPEIKEIIKRFGQTAARADAAGFDVLELHGAHGYLIASFLTPLINKRTDEYGGDRNSRMRFAFEVVNEVRANWPAHKPLFFRVSAEDGGGEGGWGLEDSVVLAAELHKIGVDVVDCSSGGLRASATLQNQGRGPGYQVPYARRIKSGAQIPTMAVGLILDGKQAEQIISSNSADFVAIGRQAMYDPFWGHHAAQQLDADPDFVRWDPSAGWWLQKRVAALDMVGYNSGGTLKASN